MSLKTSVLILMACLLTAFLIHSAITHVPSGNTGLRQIWTIVILTLIFFLPIVAIADFFKKQ